MVEGDEAVEKKRGVEKMEDFLKNSVPNGIVMNGLLLWINIQRMTTAENIWKSQLLKKNVAEEITAAKHALWEVADENIVGRYSVRRGDKKLSAEIDDIAGAMKKLQQANDLPMFLATSDMIAKGPVLNSINREEVDVGDVLNNVKRMEESMSAFIEDQKTQMRAMTESVRSIGQTTSNGP